MKVVFEYPDGDKIEVTPELIKTSGLELKIYHNSDSLTSLSISEKIYFVLTGCLTQSGIYALKNYTEKDFDLIFTVNDFRIETKYIHYADFDRDGKGSQTSTRIETNMGQEESYYLRTLFWSVNPQYGKSNNIINKDKIPVHEDKNETSEKRKPNFFCRESRSSNKKSIDREDLSNLIHKFYLKSGILPENENVTSIEKEWWYIRINTQYENVISVSLKKHFSSDERILLNESGIGLKFNESYPELTFIGREEEVISSLNAFIEHDIPEEIVTKNNRLVR